MISGVEANTALFSWAARGLRLLVDKAFLKLFDDSLLELTHALLGFRRMQEVDCSESSYVG